MSTPSWFLDELGHAGNEHLDPDYVPTFDQKSGTDPSDDLAVLGLDEIDTLVDLGAGTGTFSLAVAPRCRCVIAVDVSPVMLDFLRRRAANANVENIEYIQAGFLSYQHQGKLADVVYSRHALHHLPDFWKVIALGRIAAMLKPGGIFFLRDLIFSFGSAEAEQVIGNWLTNAAETSEQGWTRAELETHLREEYSPFSWLIEPMLERAGFEIQEVHHSESRVHSAYRCVKRP